MGHEDVIQPVSAAGDEKRAMDAGSDVEKMVSPQEPTLKRKLKSRHLQMIAIGTRNPVNPLYLLPSETHTLQVEPSAQVSSLGVEVPLLRLALRAPSLPTSSLAPSCIQS